MPIKLPKGFARRKSAGNVLEAGSAVSSFRVLHRDELAQYASSRDQRLTNKVPRRPSSSPLDLDSEPQVVDSRYLSYRTNNSNSTGCDSLTSTRYSYQSTEPSSIDSPPEDLNFKDRGVAHPPYPTYEQDSSDQDYNEALPPKFSMPSVKKQFSIPRPKFGTNRSTSRRSSDESDSKRGRSQTETTYASSYASTAQPPQVDLGPGLHARTDSEVSRGWLDVIGTGRTPIMEEPATFGLPTPPKPIFRSESDTMLATKKQFSFEEDDDRPAPLSPRLRRSPANDQPSPRSPERIQARDFAENEGVSRRSPDHHDLQRQQSVSVMPDIDASLLDALYASQALEKQYTTPVREPSKPAPSTAASAASAASAATRAYQSSPWGSRQQSQPNSTDRRNNFNGSAKVITTHQDYDESESLFGSSPATTVIHKTRTASTAPPRENRVMTPAEFERAKRNAEESNDGDPEGEASDEENLYEDEDETELARQMAKQRRKQEANLAVYRQQMTKVTGEQPTELPERPKMRQLSQSLPNFAEPFASNNGKLALEGDHSRQSSDDSDEDIPLGVLQAHGFPSKGRPPKKPAGRPLTQMSSYPTPPGSTRNDPSAGGGGSGRLPPFARHLPVDPYVGASLVNQSNRERMPYNNATGGHVSKPSGSGPPGGLVGVIAGEERARAWRRGSPNTNGVYEGIPPEAAGVPQQQMFNAMQNSQGYPYMSPGELNQMDLSNQMTQMMQMQMQWMQQMMQLQAMSQQTGTPLPPMPPMPQMPPMGNQMQMSQAQDQMQAQPGVQQQSDHLGFSFPNQQQPEEDPNMGPAHQRSASSMSGHARSSPSASSTFGVMPLKSIDGVQSRYAPSMAPSERSNVGQPSRYRPVTPHNPNASRTSTLSQAGASEGQQGGYDTLNNHRGRSPGQIQSMYDYDAGRNGFHTASDISNMAPTIRAVSKPKRGVGASDVSDEEDDAGWAEMRRKREERKSRWKPRRDTLKASNFGGLPNPGLEGLYYEGPGEY